MRFLLSRRWVLFALAVGLLALLCVRLGEWQFDRLHDREQRNEWTRTNLAAEPAPVEDVLAVGQTVPADREWMRVEVTGVYDADETVVLRYQARDGRSGVDLVTPLVTDAGTAVLVDRGWLATDNTGDLPTDPPAPPPGEVTVAGFARAGAPPLEATAVTDGSTRAISSETIARALDYPVYGGYVAARSESPEAARPLEPVETPDLGEGPHFFYGIQWWFFAALAIFGFGYLVWDERRRKQPTPKREAHARTPAP